MTWMTTSVASLCLALLLSELPQILRPVDQPPKDPALVDVRAVASKSLRGGAVARFMTLVARDVTDRTGGEWYKIVVPSGYGFIPADAVRAPDDYHVCFAKHDGRWVVVSIAESDFPINKKPHAELLPWPDSPT
jgi:hypothetical protein